MYFLMCTSRFCASCFISYCSSYAMCSCANPSQVVLRSSRYTQTRTSFALASLPDTMDSIRCFAPRLLSPSCQAPGFHQPVCPSARKQASTHAVSFRTTCPARGGPNHTTPQGAPPHSHRPTTPGFLILYITQLPSAVSPSSTSSARTRIIPFYYWHQITRP